jgi:inorganic triphosphatase YgiF
MPDSDATASVRSRARTVARLDGTPVSRNSGEADASVAAGMNLKPTASDAMQPALTIAISEHDAPPPDAPSHETAAHEATTTTPELPDIAATAGTEIELKLLVDADLLADFNNAPVITANARNKGSRKHLTSVYYDTPKHTLWRNGLSLRVRQSGARFVQTVKAQRSDDPLRRGEWEASVPGLAPDLMLAMPFIPDELRAKLESDPLDAVFVTDIRRHQRLVDMPSGTVEIAFDHGVLTAGEQTLPVSEIELELKGGSTVAIYELALRLAEHGPLRPSVRSKSARGYDLAAGTPPVVEKPRKLHLDPAVSLDETFAIILRGCFQHLLQAMPAAEDGRNPEGVHQLRVSLRRLRAALHLTQLVGTSSRLEGLQADAKWLAHSLSSARDWDVFQSATLPDIAKGCPTIAGFAALGEIAEKHRTTAYRKLRTALAERRCATFVLGLGEWIETRGWRSDVSPELLGQLAEPAVDFAGHILSERHGKVLKRGRHFKSLAPDQRHHLRLALKKLRYSVDFLLPLYDEQKSAKKYAQKLATLQEELGLYNDMATTATLLAGLGLESTDGAIAAAAITGWQAHAMAGVEAPLRQAWREFTRTETPWSQDGET